MTSIDARDAMHVVGLDPGTDPIPDGLTHRFQVTGDRKGSRNGWYRLHTDPPVNATFGTYKEPGVVHRWQPEMMVRQLMPEHRGRKPQQTVDHNQIWEMAALARDTHPYLIQKRIPAFGLRYHRGALLIPVRNIGSELQGLQRIWPDGTKRFTPGTAKAGHFFIIGTIGGGSIVICEGYATGATIHLATGYPVAVAFDAGNLLPVARGIREKFPSLKIMIAADDDHVTPGNPGLTNATEAAQAVGGSLVVPIFTSSRKPKETDLNDLAQKEGIKAVRQLFEVGGTACSE